MRTTQENWFPTTPGGTPPTGEASILYIGTLCTFSANPNGRVVRFGIQMAWLCELQVTKETGGTVVGDCPGIDLASTRQGQWKWEGKQGGVESVIVPEGTNDTSVETGELCRFS